MRIVLAAIVFVLLGAGPGITAVALRLAYLDRRAFRR